MALQPCHSPGCGKVQEGPYCNRHQAQHSQERAAYDVARGNAASRGYDADWDRLRREYAEQHKTCERCGQRETQTVHHRISVKERPDLRLERSNLEGVCASCHQKRHRGGRA